MKYAYITAVALAAMALAAQAQTKIYRCGNTYTNSEAEAKAKGCKPMDGGNITVVEGLKPASTTRVATAPTQANGGPRMDSEEQKQRDNDARGILEAELKKSEARQAELLKEYNNGEPERQGGERNAQKYNDRVAEMRAAITRKEEDIAAIKREIAKLPQ